MTTLLPDRRSYSRCSRRGLIEIKNIPAYRAHIVEEHQRDGDATDVREANRSSGTSRRRSVRGLHSCVQMSCRSTVSDARHCDFTRR